MLDLREEALRVLDVKTAAIHDNRKSLVEPCECRLILDRTHDEVILGPVGFHPVVVGDRHIEDWIAGLGPKVPHHGEIHLDLIGPRCIGQNNGSIGEVGLSREGISGVGEDLEVSGGQPNGGCP